MQFHLISTNDKLKLSLALSATAVLTFSLFTFVNNYAPVLIYMDRWMSMGPLFDDSPFWKGFTHKHGPHRMGLIYILFSITSYFSEWNSRADMFLQASIYSITALLALRLKYLLFKKLNWFDWVIPAIFITTQSALTVTFNPYVHGLIPFFAVSISLCYCINNITWRILSQALLAAIGVFSGFALVVSLTFLAVEGFFWLKKPSLKTALVLIIPLASLTFMITTQGKSPPLSFDNPIEYYLQFITFLSLDFIVVRPLDYWPALLVGGLSILIFLFWKNQNSESTSTLKTVLLLVGSSLIFVLLTAAGRADMGMGNALNSRYIPAMMPLMLGVYFLILKLDLNAWKYTFLMAFAAIMLRFHFMQDPPRINNVIKQSAEVAKWENCFLQNKSYNKCSEEINESFVPESKKKGLQEKIDFLKANKLNIFKE